jgi:epoxyqueuosine reductase
MRAFPSPDAPAKVANLRRRSRAQKWCSPIAREFAAEIERRARELGASLVGFAPVARWADAGEVPEPYRPTAIWPGARTVVTFGVPMLLPVIDSTPSINYQEMYDASNRLLDDLGYRLAVWLSDRGHASVFLRRGALDAQTRVIPATARRSAPAGS